MRELRIPRSIKKTIKNQAKVESGLYGNQKGGKDFSEMTQEEKMKDSQRYDRKQRFNDSALGKLFSRGKYNKVKVKEGVKLTPEDKVPPRKPTLEKSGYQYRKFKSNGDNEEGEQVFSISATSPKDAYEQILKKKEELGIKNVGSGTNMDLSEHPEQIRNEQKINSYKQELKDAKYVTGSRTDAVKTKKERLKAQNKGLSRRGAYRFAKRLLIDEYKNKTK